MNRREAVSRSAIAATAALAGGMSNAKAAGGGTFVLVHGAFHGGWCWSRVAEPLRAAGHRVFTPSCTGLAERSHLLNPVIELGTFIEDVAKVIEFEELNDVILVGHSFGGYSISGVADRMPQRLKHLVYLDAAVPRSGVAPFDEIPAEVREQRLKLASTINGTQVLNPPPATAFGVTDAKDIAWVDRRTSPMPARTYTTSITLKDKPGGDVAKTFIRCTNPTIPQVEGSAAYAKANGWKYIEMATGHDIMVTDPKRLTDFLLTLA